ncbi:hypothetical protein QBC36DRAFT_347835 [Triangularia setosa]|uniref:Protein-ribulosamine 3-kinase n=1 Tax=Triangularia setosa TaxID=2587417 RepID=A0AAN6W5H7_9PEZI|nr:hypothetical protein QBC36DRAFT_347835 [Podospora setosa]
MDDAEHLSKSSNIRVILAQLSGAFPMDQEAILKLLPRGIKLMSVKKFGVSAFTATGRIKALESTVYYFLSQVAYGEQGRVMLNGEAPDFIPKPAGFGAYVQAPAAYFYLSEFVDMAEDVTTPPDPAEWSKRLANMHKQSRSPTGYRAMFYRKLFLGICRLDIEANGSWPALTLELATKQVADVIIPQFLGNLKTPAVRKPTSLSSDAGSYFAHNEMELGHWRCEFIHDCNRLYSLKGAIVYSVGHPNNSLKKTAYNNMLYLIEKYGPLDGVDKYNPSIDPSITGACIVPHLAEGLI